MLNVGPVDRKPFSHPSLGKRCERWGKFYNNMPLPPKDIKGGFAAESLHVCRL